MKKKFLSVLLTLMMVLSVTPSAAHAAGGNQNTENKNWYDDAVIYCSRNGLLLDYLRSDSLLQENVTWSILTQVLSDVTTNYSEELYTSKTDSSASVNWAKDFALMENALAGDDVVTRSDAATTLSSFFDKSNIDVLLPLSVSSFSDFYSISDNCKSSVLFVETNSLMIGYGDGTFGGNDPLSICQLAQILYNGRDIFSNVIMNKLFSLNENQIDYIEFQDGNTGCEEVITEQVKLSNIVQLLNSFKIDSIKLVESDGWSYRIKLHYSSGTEADLYISSNSVSINNVKYISAVQHFSSIL